MLTSQFREKFQRIPLDERVNYIKSLSKEEIIWMFQHPEVFLFDKQIPPDRAWRYHWYRGGRGIGKTFASTSWLYGKVIGGAQEVAIVGPDYQTLIKEILPVFESHFPPHLRPKFNSKDNLYKCYNDCVVKVYSSETEIRGLNAEFGIAEEICKWCDQIPDKIQERFDLFDLGVRSRRAQPCPQIFIASTPKPFPIFIKFEEQFNAGNPLYSMVIAETKENVYLSPAAKQAFYDKYSGTRLGRQELAGDLLTDNPDALWSAELIEKARIERNILERQILEGKLKVLRSCVTVDPAVTTNKNSDETGIIVAALLSDNKVYILEDCSGKHSPDEWAQLAVNKYKEHNAAYVIMESNQGGNILETNIKTVDRYVRTKLIHASVSKQTRFEPVVAAYERGEVKHVGDLSQLEKQMLSYNPYQANVSSPDRADAMAYAVYFLLLDQQAPAFRRTKNLGNW